MWVLLDCSAASVARRPAPVAAAVGGRVPVRVTFRAGDALPRMLARGGMGEGPRDSRTDVTLGALGPEVVSRRRVAVDAVACRRGMPELPGVLGGVAQRAGLRRRLCGMVRRRLVTKRAVDLTRRVAEHEYAPGFVAQRAVGLSRMLLVARWRVACSAAGRSHVVAARADHSDMSWHVCPAAVHHRDRPGKWRRCHAGIVDTRIPERLDAHLMPRIRMAVTAAAF